MTRPEALGRRRFAESRTGRVALVSIVLVLAGCGASASETPRESAAAHESATPEPSASTEPSTGWETVATFGQGGGWNFASTVVRSGELFLAVGSRAEPAQKVGYDHAGELLWTSTDGQSWDEVPLGSELDGLFFRDVVAGPGGSFIAYVEVSYALGSGTTNNAIWQSPDGRTWQEADTDLDPSLLITKVVQGPHGYLLLSQSLGVEPSLWLSADGLQWDEVHRFSDPTHIVDVEDIGAGDEGFVVFGVRVALDNSWERFAFASADGREWIDAPNPVGAEDPLYRPRPVIAPLGPDWVAATAQRDGGVRIWFSANGLDWAQAAVIPEVNTQAWGPVMVAAKGRLFFSPTGEFPSFIGAPGVWSSSDGHQWEPLDLAEDGVVAGAASGPAGMVLAGATFPNENESAATFWLGP